MALLWMEGFEVRVHTDYQLRLYTSAIGGITTALGGRKHGNSIIATGSGFAPPSPLIASVENTWIVQFAVRKDQATELADDGMQITIHDGVGEQVSVVQVAGGEANGSFKMEIRRGATVLGTSQTYVWGANPQSWHAFQFKVLVHPTTGTFALRHWDYFNNMTTPLSGSGANTANQGTAGADRVAFSFGAAGVNQRMDDIVIMDGSGGLNDDWTAKPFVVHGALPQANGTNTDWLPSSGGNHAALIDDPVYSPGGTDKVTTAQVSDIDTLTMLAFGLLAPTSTPVIAGVMPYIEGAMENSGTRTIRARIRNGVTEANGAEDLVFTSTSKAALHEIMEVNPVTTVAWVKADLDDDEFGFQMTV